MLESQIPKKNWINIFMLPFHKNALNADLNHKIQRAIKFTLLGTRYSSLKMLILERATA